MIPKKDMNYLKELAWKSKSIKGDFEREVFICACSHFQAFKTGKFNTKNVTKEQLINYLISKGLMQRKADGGLPDDRPVRAAARSLLKAGLPLVATSNNKGYYIVEKPCEVDLPQAQNYNRAKKLLAVDKGYNEIRNFLTNGRLFL